MRAFIDFELPAEVWEAFLAARNGALLGQDFVTTYQDTYVWEEGREFAMADFHGLTLFMAGVFTPSDPSYRNVILADRVFLQEVDDQRGISHQIFVKLDDRAYAREAAAAIDALGFPVKTQTESAQVALDQAIDDLDDMMAYAGYVIAFAVLVILLCIANTISMSTYDRTQEIGVLRAMGFDRPRVVRLVLAESILLSLMGGVLGCLAAYALLALSPQQLSLRGETIALVLRPAVLAAGVALSALVGLLGGLAPAVSAARVDIVRSLRPVE